MKWPLCTCGHPKSRHIEQHYGCFSCSCIIYESQVKPNCWVCGGPVEACDMTPATDDSGRGYVLLDVYCHNRTHKSRAYDSSAREIDLGDILKSLWVFPTEPKNKFTDFCKLL